MRSAPVTLAGANRLPFECRLRFHRPLKGVEVVPADSVATAPKPTPPQARPEPKPAPPPPAPAPPAPVPATEPAVDFSQTELARELAADRDRIEAVLAEVRSDIVALRMERAAKIEDLQRVAIELAVAISSRLLHERVAADDLPMDTKLRDMVAQLGDDVAVNVRLNPLDLQLLKARLGEQPLSPDRDDPRFTPDPALNRGECQVEGRESMLLSELTRELHEIRDDLLGSLTNARP